MRVPIPSSSAGLRALCGLLVLGSVTAAASEPAHTDRYVEIAVDGGPHSSQSTEVPLFGQVLVSPGDHDQRRLVVKNTGPDRAVMTASITKLHLSGDDADSFFADLLIDGVSVTGWSSRTDAELRRTDLDPGESTAVDVSYDFPASATSGNGSDELQVSFGVRVELEELPGQMAEPRRHGWWSRTVALVAAAAAAGCALGAAGFVGVRTIRARGLRGPRGPEGGERR